MRTNALLCLTRIISVALFSATAIIAQTITSTTDGATPLGIAPGTPAGSYALNGFDNVNLYNGGLNFSLPILKIGGRGGAGYAMTVKVDQKFIVHKEQELGEPNRYYADESWWDSEVMFSMGQLAVRHGVKNDYYNSCGAFIPRETLTRLTFTAPDGTEYELRDQLTGGRPDYPTCPVEFNRGRTFTTADGTSATFISETDIIDSHYGAETYPSGYLLLRDGTRFRIDAGLVSWMRDRNGNKATFTYDVYRRLTAVSDSLNRQITITYGEMYGYDQITLKGFAGTVRTLKLYRAALRDVLRSGFTELTPLQLFPELDGGGAGASKPVISAVELPNGQTYQFKYDPYGELARVQLPTGGAIEYDWAAGTTDGPASGVISITGNKQIYRRVVERRVYPDGGAGSSYASRMTYSRPESSSSNAGYVIADQYNSTGAMLSRSHHYFYGSARSSLFQIPTQYPGWKDGKEYLTVNYAADGTTPLTQSSTTFTQRVPVSWWTGNPDLAPPNDVRVTETITTIEPAGANVVSKQTFGYDDSVPFNNQNNVKEYDFGPGTAGSLLRESRTTFVTATNYTGSDVHLRGLPLQVSIHDGGGIERARTSYEYDNYASDTNHAPLTSRANISGFDSSFSTSYLTRGNATATTQYFLNGSGAITGSISAYAQYDIGGNVVKTIDARGYSTNLEYTDRFGSPDGEARLTGGSAELGSQASYAFATKATNAFGHTAYTQFDYYLGRPVDGEDANGVVASGYYSDVLDRPTQIVRAANQGASVKSQTTFSYDDTNRVITTTSDQNTFGDNILKSQIVYDGLGRTTDKRQYESPSAYITVRQTYDALGRSYQTSNPFRAGESVVWTTAAYDALSRVVTVTTPDSAVVATSYGANTVTVTDQAGKQRKSVTDALGRLVQVYEAPNDPTNYNYLTSYAYDTLDNLTQVTQGTQPPRTFVYDSLKRLTSANNPESGTVNYQYDNNGNLLVKTDARLVSSHYEYDALNRASRRWYNGSSLLTATTHNSPALPSGVGASDEVKYFYDAQTLPGGAPTFDRGYSTGRLVATTYGRGSAGTYFGYDALGRALRSIQQTASVNYQTSAIYNLAGAMTSMTYPSGRTVTNAFDNAGRLSSFTGNLGDGTTRTYANQFEYTSWNGLQQERFGTDIAIYHKQRFNQRGQLWDMRASTVPFATDPANGDRGAIVNYYSNNFTQGGSGTDNNGNLLRQENYIPGSSFFQDNFTYDALNRLTSIAEKLNGTGTDSFKQAYIYDRWGNRTIDQVNTTANVPKPNFGVNTATNRLTPPAGYAMTHDQAGNLTNDTYTGQGTRTYDAENRMKQAWANSQWQTYTYDGDGRRIKRNVNGTETWQVYGMGGELLAEYPANGTPPNPQKEYCYRNGELLVTTETSSSGGGSSAQPVIWTNTVGVAVNGNSLTKTAAQGWGNAGAASTQSIASGDGYVEFTTNGSQYQYVICGLSNGDSNQNYPDVDFGFYPAATDLYVIESGTTHLVSSYTVGDTLRVAVESGVVKYRKNGTVVYTSSISPSYPLLVDTALYSGGISNAVTSSGGGGGSSTQNASWTNAVGVAVSGNSLTKTAAQGWGNAGAASTQTIASGDGYVEFTTTGSQYQYVICGLSNGDSNQNYPDVDFGFYPAATDLYVIESGTTHLVSSYTVGDTLRVAVESGIVKYRKNGTVVYTSSISPSYPLLVDTALYSGGISNAVTSSGGGGGSSTQIRWLVADHLGTPRMIFDQSGLLANVSRHDYLPFGEELYAGTGGRTTGLGYTASDNVRQKFTSYERDVESGLDYAQARYYAHAQGRFTSPDPLGESASGANPQTFNRYSYVNNSPLTTIDPSGMFGICPGGGQQGMYVGGFSISEKLPGRSASLAASLTGAAAGASAGTEPTAQQGPRSLSSNVPGVCSLLVEFTGPGMEQTNGPGYDAPQDRWGVGFTVSGYVVDSAIGVVERRGPGGSVVPDVVNPNGEWTVQQWASVSATVTRDAHRGELPDVRDTRPDGPTRGNRKVEGGTFVYGDFPGFIRRTPQGNLTAGRAEFSFSAKVIRGYQQCEVKFNMSMAYKQGHISASWGPRP